MNWNSYMYHNRSQNHFSCKKHKKKLKILSSKFTQQIEEIMWINPLFDLSWYLNPLSRYKDSKAFNIAQRLWMDQWPTFFPRNAYYILPGIASITCLKFEIG